MISVGYRFIFAGLFLYIIAKIQRKKISLKKSEHLYVLLMGITLFSFNYWLFYLSEIYITSAIPAIIFTTVTFFNILNEKILYRELINRRVLIGSLLGFPGVVLVFYSELNDPKSVIVNIGEGYGEKLLGFGLAVLGTMIASWGNIITKQNRKLNIDILSMNTIGMLYGGTLITIMGILLGKNYRIDWSMEYILSFIYLSLFASVLAFTFYVALIDKIGPSKSSFVFFFTPIGATLTSIIFEKQQSNKLTLLLGTLLVIIGTYTAHSQSIKKLLQKKS